MKKDNCIFCKIVNGEIPSRKLYEDENFIVILDVGPASKGHSLIIPKDHYANIYEMPEALCAEAMKVAKKMSAKLTDGLAADGLNILQNNGEAAGQTVHHFHMHLIPRYKDAEKLFEYAPLSFEASEMEAIKDAIV